MTCPAVSRSTKLPNLCAEALQPRLPTLSPDANEMKICFFQLVPHYGGAATSCIEVCRRLSQHAEVSFVDPYGCSDRFRNKIEKLDVAYHILKPSPRGHEIGGWGNPIGRLACMAMKLPHMRMLARLLDKELAANPPDVICTDNLKSAFILSFSKQGRKIPVVYYLRGWFRPSQINAVGRWLCKRHATRIIAVSYATAAALNCNGIQFNKINTLHNPINVERITQASEGAPSHPLPQSNLPLRMLLPAGIMKEKGQHTAVLAMKILRSKGYDGVLWIAGDHQSIGPNRPYLDQLEALIRDLQLTDAVHFIGLRDDIPQVMRAATHVLLPSHSEGHPRSILEAMALKRPVLSTPAGGCMDLVIHGLTGRLFDFDRADQLAAEVEAALKNQTDTNRMVQTAYNWICQAYSTNAHTKALMQIFKETISLQAAGHRCGAEGALHPAG